jgi:hypothetical protein
MSWTNLNQVWTYNNALVQSPDHCFLLNRNDLTQQFAELQTRNQQQHAEMLALSRAKADNEELKQTIQEMSFKDSEIRSSIVRAHQERVWLESALQILSSRTIEETSVRTSAEATNQSLRDNIQNMSRSPIHPLYASAPAASFATSPVGVALPSSTTLLAAHAGVRPGEVWQVLRSPTNMTIPFAGGPNYLRVVQ